MTTFIVGSKEPVVPDTVPSQIIAANGAASVFLDLIKDGVPLTLLMTPYLLYPNIGPYVDREKLRIDTIEQMCKPEISRLIIRPGIYTDCKKMLESPALESMSVRHVECWNFLEMDRLILKTYGRREILRYCDFSFRKLFSGSMFRRVSTLAPFKMSTGMMCLALAIKDNDCTPPYYVIGVGASDGSYKYSPASKADRAPHLKADFNLLRVLAKSKFGSEIIITDSELNEKYQKFSSQ